MDRNTFILLNEEMAEIGRMDIADIELARRFAKKASEDPKVYRVEIRCGLHVECYEDGIKTY